MATIHQKKNNDGSNRCQVSFTLGNGRKTLSLGSKYSQNQVKMIALYVGELERVIATGGEPNRKLQAFLDDMTDDLRERFERAGLIEESKKVTLAELYDRFTNDPNGRKDSTLRTYETVIKRLFAFFDRNGNPDEITEEDGLEWRESLREHYAEATVTGCIQRMRTMFSWGVRAGYLRKNIFLDIPRGSFVNRDRMFFVSRESYGKLLDACPDQTWRTILALCRIGGLRNPSETLAVRWEDVNWEKQAVLIRSPKTERHVGHDARIIPMFPGLREELEKQFDAAEEGGSPFVIDRWRDTEMNMRTHFERIVFRAGLQQWPRLFQNLRESRANELWSEYPEHVAGYWMGHSRRIAEKHYLQVTDEQFLKALGAAQTPVLTPNRQNDKAFMG